MDSKETIAAEEFCVDHQVELGFIKTLGDTGLIELIRLEEKLHLPVSQLNHLKTLARLYYDLGVNFSGLQTIHYLLVHLKTLTDQVQHLNGRLEQYEAKANRTDH